MNHPASPYSCARCLQPFRPHHHLQRYCCPGCESSARLARDRARKRAARIARGLPVGPQHIHCRHCGQPVLDTNGSRRICGQPACVDAAHQAKLQREADARRRRAADTEQHSSTLQRLLCHPWGRRA